VSVEGRAADRLLFLEALLVFLLLFVPLQAYLGEAQHMIFTARDLDRAQALAAGHPIFFGPEMSGRGHLPGPFFYLLLALPLGLGLGWRGVWELQFALMGGAAVALWAFVRVRFGVPAAYYALFCLSFFDFPTLLIAWNPSFLPLFAIVALAALTLAFDPWCAQRGLAWGVFSLACGLGLQLHMSAVLLLAAGPLVQVAAPRLRLSRLPWRAFALGLLPLGAVLAPYAAWEVGARLGVPLGQPVLAFTDAVGPDVGLDDKIGGLVAYAIEARADKPLGSQIARVLAVLPLEVVVPLLLLPFLGRVGGEPPAPPARPPAPAVAHAARVLAFPAMLTASSYAISLALGPVRYSILPRLCLDLWICAVLANRRLRGSAWAGLAFGLFAATVAWQVALGRAGRVSFDAFDLVFPVASAGVLALLAWHRGAARGGVGWAPLLPLALAWAVHVGAAAGRHGSVPSARDLTALARLVVGQTGWGYPQARLGLFWVNVRDTLTPAWIFREVARDGVEGPAPSPGVARVDGYFVVRPRVATPPWADPAEAARWLVAQDLPGMLRDGLAGGGLTLGIPTAAGSLWAIPYHVADRDRLPPRFHNGSEGYADTQMLPPLPVEPGPRVGRAVFNDCDNGADVCGIAADVRVRPAGPGRWDVEVTLSGEPLSQACDGVNMVWNERLERPWFGYSCDGAAGRVGLADFVGMRRDAARSANGSLLGPYERRFEVGCASEPEALVVGYEGASAITRTRPVKGLPGRALPVGRTADAGADR